MTTFYIVFPSNKMSDKKDPITLLDPPAYARRPVPGTKPLGRADAAGYTAVSVCKRRRVS